MTLDKAEKPSTTGVSIVNGRVLPEWIDFNGHMNVAYYVLAFDLGVDELWEQLGITAEYIKTTHCSTFAVECHVTYQGELKEDEPFRITSQILAYDNKRIHQFQRMYHAEKNYLAATAEWMNLHVDLKTRKVTAFADHVLAKLAEYTGRQGIVTRPDEAGQQMRVKNPIFFGIAQ